MLEKLLAGGGLAAALAASTCCVLPLGLGAIGVSSAWTSGLAAFAPYQTFFRLLAILLLGTAFWLVYGRSRAGGTGTECEPAPSRPITKAALWLGALITGLVLSAGWWQQFV